MIRFLSLQGRASEQSIRMARLERKVDLLLERLEIDPNADVDPEVVSLMKAGRKIEAIKKYRECTGAGLKEAKDYVERL